MNWTDFTNYYYIISFFWIVSIVSNAEFFSSKLHKIGIAFGLIGTLLLSFFIAKLWIHLERPPLRTLGETRMLYSFFLSITGLLLYLKWNYRWLLAFCLSMSWMFLTINNFNPETFSKTLMPALQSPLFVPHVVVYILAYAILGASSIVAIKALVSSKNLLSLADNLVYLGVAFLSFGLIFGAVWAKEAWGHYWTWDPKETWAFLTWVSYLIYIHFRIINRDDEKKALWILSFAFLILLICWFGVNYLPTTNYSIHTYTKY